MALYGPTSCYPGLALLINSSLIILQPGFSPGTIYSLQDLPRLLRRHYEKIVFPLREKAMPSRLATITSRGVV